MEPFLNKCPQIAVDETRTIRVQGHDQLPDGEYGFMELYCSDPKCDCRRVMIWVVARTTGQKIWASINYGWENMSFYKKWSSVADENCQGPILDPVNPQSPYAPIFLEYFKEMLKDVTFADRFAKHYNLHRKALKRRK
jgi:hypothetical protein